MAEVHAGRFDADWTTMSTEYLPSTGRVNAGELEWLEPHAANVVQTNPLIRATRGITRFIESSFGCLLVGGTPDFSSEFTTSHGDETKGHVCAELLTN
jgi:hypothetical protein